MLVLCGKIMLCESDTFKVKLFTIVITHQLDYYNLLFGIPTGESLDFLSTALDS